MLEHPTTSSVVQVLIVDDDEITRIGLRHALERMNCFAGIQEASDAVDLLARLESHPVDLILLDINMPGLNGIEAARKIKQRFPQIKILMLSYFDSEDKVGAALNAGADAYCVKSISVDKLRLAIDCVLQGAVWLDPLIARKALGHMGKAEASDPFQPAASTTATFTQRSSKRLDLTEREYDVLRLITQGKSNKEIGLILAISPYTVKTHIRNLTQKLGVEDRTQAAVKALTDSLILGGF